METKIIVGTDTYFPWKHYSRDEMVSFAREKFNLPSTYIEQLTDKELFNILLKLNVDTVEEEK